MTNDMTAEQALNELLAQQLQELTMPKAIEMLNNTEICLKGVRGMHIAADFALCDVQLLQAYLPLIASDLAQSKLLIKRILTALEDAEVRADLQRDCTTLLKQMEHTQ